jgi:uncharacterized membrane protein YfcA
MDPVRIAAGALTGFVVGMTGVGGGALMTPILLLVFGYAPLTAVGTDLWFAAITKIAVAGLHIRDRLIDWGVVARLWTGSLPASLLTVLWMASRTTDETVVLIVRGAIGVAVCLTALSLLLRSRLSGGTVPRDELKQGTVPCFDPTQGPVPTPTAATIAVGAMLGFLVTLTSVGAGAVGAVCLYHLYPTRLTPVRLVATDIAHAIPLALCAGVGHLAISQVDPELLRDLLLGSIPAALVGAALSERVPHSALRLALASVLLVVGVLMAGDAIR